MYSIGKTGLAHICVTTGRDVACQAPNREIRYFMTAVLSVYSLTILPCHGTVSSSPYPNTHELIYDRMHINSKHYEHIHTPHSTYTTQQYTTSTSTPHHTT